MVWFWLAGFPSIMLAVQSCLLLSGAVAMPSVNTRVQPLASEHPRDNSSQVVITFRIAYRDEELLLPIHQLPHHLSSLHLF